MHVFTVVALKSWMSSKIVAFKPICLISSSLNENSRRNVRAAFYPFRLSSLSLRLSKQRSEYRKRYSG